MVASVRVAASRSAHGAHVEYRVETLAAAGGHKEHAVAWRRFREFDALRRELKAGDYDVRACPLPSKLFGTGAEARVEALGELMQRLVAALVVGEDFATAPLPLIEFCGLRETLKRASQASVGADVPFRPVPAPHAERMEGIISGVRELGALAQSGGAGALAKDGWKKVGSSGPVEWHSHAELNRRMVFGVVPHCTAQMVHDILYRPSDFKKLETNLATVADVARLGPQTVLQHVTCKSIMWMPCRDLILLRHWRVLPDGTTVHGDFTLDDYEGVPAMDTGGLVRARETFGGTFLKMVGVNRCFVMIVNDMDPRVPGAASLQAQINDYSAGLLSANLLNLLAMVKKKDLQAYMSKPPMSNLGDAEAAPPADDPEEDQDAGGGIAWRSILLAGALLAAASAALINTSSIRTLEFDGAVA